jgi:hypothetical protein
MAAFNLTPTQTWSSTQSASTLMSVIGMEFRVQSSGVAGTVKPTRRLLTGIGV